MAIIPSPFENSQRVQPNPTDSQIQEITFNGQTIRVTVFDENDSRIQAFRLPSNGLVRHEFGTSGNTSNERIEFQDPNGFPRYAYSRDASGVQFTQKDSESGPTKIIPQKDFIAAANSVLGPYDSGFSGKMGLALQSEKSPLHNAFATIVSKALNITLDDHAAVIEKHAPGALSKPVQAFLNGQELVVPPNMKTIANKPYAKGWIGNEWSPELHAQLGKVIPEKNLAEIKHAMNGSVIVNIHEVTDDSVCRAVSGKPVTGIPDPCKAPRR